MTMTRSILPALLIICTACGNLQAPDDLGKGADMRPASPADQAGPGLVAQIQGPRSLTVYERVSLTGSSNAAPGVPVVYRWSLEARPDKSAASLTSSGESATFITDAVGDYQVRLEAFDGARTSDAVVATIRAEARVARDDVPRGVFDPGEVYLLGTTSEGACYRDAIAHWSDPEVAAAGFDCYADDRTAQIKPDGFLAYKNTFEDVLREFHCDDCPGFGRGKPYPSNVLDNDPKLATAPCDKIDGFLIGVTGARLHSCNGAWYDEAGKVLPFSQPLAYGHRDKVLTASSVVDIRTGKLTPVTGMPANIVATRVATPSGFWVATSGSPEPELWEVSEDGAAKKLLTYAPPPMGYKASFGARLDGKGNLFQMGQGPMVFEDTIVYRGRDGVSRVVYTEATNPFVKIHISSLTTGP
jgi:hypothetical protein